MSQGYNNADAYCWNRDLPVCRNCRRNIVNHADVDANDPRHQWLRPHVDGTRCLDWQPIPIAATDSTHTRL